VRRIERIRKPDVTKVEVTEKVRAAKMTL